MTDEQIEKAAEEYAIKKTEQYIPQSHGDLRHRRVAQRFDSYDVEQEYEDGAKAALASQWVSVKDAGCPESIDLVLAHIPPSGTKQARSVMAWYDGVHWLTEDGKGIRPSHWMAIPPLYNEKEPL